MIEFVQQAFMLDSASWFVLGIMVFAAIVLVHNMIDDNILTAICIPALFVCAVSARRALELSSIQLTADKVVNTGFAFGVGLVAFGTAVAIFFWFKRTVLRT